MPWKSCCVTTLCAGDLRTTAEPVAFGDVEIPAGEQVVGLLGAANRDPSIYPDPNKLDLTRSGVRASSFGGGIHICLGARLARLEGEVAFKTLMDRIPDLSLPEATHAGGVIRLRCAVWKDCRRLVR